MNGSVLLLGWALLGQVGGSNRYQVEVEEPPRRAPFRVAAGDDHAGHDHGQDANNPNDIGAVLRGIQAERDRVQADSEAVETLPRPSARLPAARVEATDDSAAKAPARSPAVTQPSTQAPRTVNPVETLASAFATPRENVLPGAPTTLVAALSRRSDREGRLAIARAYWKLSAAAAAQKMAVDEHVRLADLPKPERVSDPAIDHDLWVAARASAAARVSETAIIAVTAQRELSEAMSLSPNDDLPVAADTPFLGEYATKFDEIFTNRSAPVRLRTIHDTLPRLLAAIGQRAEAAAAAQSALDRSEQRYVEGKFGINTYLAQFAYGVQQRQAFLAVARAYNEDIAEYAVNVAREDSSPTELAGMMIRLRAAAPDAAGRRNAPVRSADARNKAGSTGLRAPTTGGARTYESGTTFDRGTQWQPR